jgi:hypothetical protein
MNGGWDAPAEMISTNQKTGHWSRYCVEHFVDMHGKCFTNEETLLEYRDL